MSEIPFLFSTQHPERNREEIDRILALLEKRHPHYALLVSQSISEETAHVRFALAPIFPCDAPDYYLGTLHFPADTNIEVNYLLNPVSEAIREYEERMR